MDLNTLLAIVAIIAVLFSFAIGIWNTQITSKRLKKLKQQSALLNEQIEKIDAQIERTTQSIQEKLDKSFKK
ncbi:MAG: hypothetical protein NT099_06010 [Candidatus Saganbacteria bacterium]|nr:hypothetical protein [Candidatus Saganbacteria bacterium]